ncbi:tRNA adenosine(34) deaminase TadA [Colwellia sp. UCD-KL20]|uniref:tRNA adenosine(34) deaminase TadA n=1 Tax=Colwellia sp. UCD-KL20 TaxID=1917165 RepID=UPI0009709A56|nr:tRNA adenosine(34) deaminase TadA [Colwellia sp. UCD-KL20]
MTAKVTHHNDQDQQETDIKFMQRAYELAQQAEQINEIPVGAVVVAEGKIIGEGFNQSITLNDPSAHAEMLAIKQAGQALQNYRLIDCTLYVTLEPCPMCAGLLVHSRIKRLVFAANDLKTGAAGSAFNLVAHEKHNHKIETTKGVLAEQCSALLSAFFKRRRAEIKAKKKQDKIDNEQIFSEEIANRSIEQD